MTYTNEFNEQFNVAEIRVSYKPNTDITQRPQISNSRDAAEIFRASWNEDTIQFYEEFKVICLNHANRVLGIWEASKGSKSATIVDISHLMAVALLTNSSAIMIAHNHPTGTLKPSAADQSLTRQIQTACLHHSIELLDHIIISDGGYYSFADEGIL